MEADLALTATVYVFEIELSDTDNDRYATLSLKVACHPSESREYMFTRVLAYALEHQEGIAFSQGLAAAEEPALWIHDLTGRLQAWIEVGTPDAARLHKAAKSCPRVVVYCHKEIGMYLRNLGGHKVHTPERVRLVALDRRFIEAGAALCARRTSMAVTVSESQLYVDLGGQSLTSPLTVHPLPG